MSYFTIVLKNYVTGYLNLSVEHHPYRVPTIPFPIIVAQTAKEEPAPYDSNCSKCTAPKTTAEKIIENHTTEERISVCPHNTANGPYKYCHQTKPEPYLFSHGCAD